MPPATISAAGTQSAGVRRSSVRPLLVSPATTKIDRMDNLPMLNAPPDFSASAGPMRLTTASTAMLPMARIFCMRMRVDAVEERDTVYGKGTGINGQENRVAQHQENIQRSGEQPEAEGPVDEDNGAAPAGVGQGEMDIGIDGQQRDDAADEKGEIRRPPGFLAGQSEGCKDAAPDNAADADGKSAQQADRPARCFRCAGDRWIGHVPLYASAPDATGLPDIPFPLSLVHVREQ